MTISVFQQDSVPEQSACNTVQLLQRETLNFIVLGHSYLGEKTINSCFCILSGSAEAP